MANPLSKAAEVIEKKLQCYICFEQVGTDAVETVCQGRHTFCFSCIAQHIMTGINGIPSTTQLFPSDEDTPSCPVCRGGKCSVMPSQFLADLSSAIGIKKDEGVDLLELYKDLFPLLKRKFPVVYDHSCSPKNGIINCPQVRLFMYYKDRPSELVPRREHIPRTRRNAIYRSSPLSWASVQIDTESEVFVVSKHRSEQEARRLVSNAPTSFDRTFIVGICESESIVTFQARPVQIFMSVGVEIGHYFETTLPEYENKDAIIRLMTRPEILRAQSGEDRVGRHRFNAVSTNEGDEQEDDSLSWLPM